MDYKKILAIMAAIVFAILCAELLNVYAVGSEYEFGVDEIRSALPDEAQSELDKSGISPDNSGAANLNIKTVLKEITEMIKSRAMKPLKLFCSLFGVTVLSVLAQQLTDQSSLKGVFAAISALCGAGIAAAAVGDVLDETLGVLSQAADFTLVFIPAFTGIAAALGHVSSASAVNSAVLAATQLFSQIAAKYLAPLCAVILGISAAGAADSELKLEKIGDLVKKAAVWGLTLIMTIFMSVLSIQTVVTSAADNSAIKAAKFIVSQGVPFVGGTISDAVNMVSGGLTMLKGSVGTYGIIGAAVVLLPALASLFCCLIALSLSEYTAQMFGQKELSVLYKSCGSVMSIVIAVTVCFLVLNVIAVFIMLSVTGTVSG